MRATCSHFQPRDVEVHSSQLTDRRCDWPQGFFALWRMQKAL